MKRPMVFEGGVAILLILLLFAMYFMLTGSGNPVNNWEVKVNKPVWDIYAGDDGTLFAFTGPTGNTIDALDSYGNLKWVLQIPGQWHVLNPYDETTIPGAGNPQGIPRGYTSIVKPVYTANNGTLYLYLRENRTTPSNYYPWDTPPFTSPDRSFDDDSAIEERLLAISHDGKVLWNVSIGNYYLPLSGADLFAENGRIYAFHSYNLTLLDDSGSVIRTIGDISDTPAVDEQGFIYTSVSNKTETWMGYEGPSGVVIAYFPNGTIYWTNQIEKPVSRPMPDESFGQQHSHLELPIYQDHMLYLPLKDGVMAIGTNGSMLWTREFDAGYYYPFPTLPIDITGNVYLEYHLDMNGGTYVKVVNRAGYNLTTFNRINTDWLSIVGDPYEGWLYEDKGIYHGDIFTLENLTTFDVRAHDLVNGDDKWTLTLPIHNISSFIIDNGTISALDQYAYLTDSSSGLELLMNDSYMAKIGNISPGVFPIYPLKMSVGKDAVYVSLFTANYEGPVVMGQSRCTYSGGIYAIGKNGTLLWYKPTGAFASSISENNDTVFYATKNGIIGSGGMDTIAGGVTLLALAYVFFRFFFLGAVARAKDRLNMNENRNNVLSYITNNPGSTLREISRGLNLNLGTLRYHILILGLNHRIVTCLADDKHVRYFTNSNMYSKEEQLIISLMKRDGIRMILTALSEKPSFTNVELSRELNMQESSTSRYMRELIERGIAVKEPDANGMSAFAIKSEHRPTIAGLVERIH